MVKKKNIFKKVWIQMKKQSFSVLGFVASAIALTFSFTRKEIIIPVAQQSFIGEIVKAKFVNIIWLVRPIVIVVVILFVYSIFRKRR